MPHSLMAPRPPRQWPSQPQMQAVPVDVQTDLYGPIWQESSLSPLRIKSRKVEGDRAVDKDAHITPSFLRNLKLLMEVSAQSLLALARHDILVMMSTLRIIWQSEKRNYNARELISGDGYRRRGRLYP